MFFFDIILRLNDVLFQIALSIFVHVYKFVEGSLVYGHFGPKTLRTQDISALVPKCPMEKI